MYRLFLCFVLFLLPLLPYQLKDSFAILALFVSGVLLQKRNIVPANKWINALFIYCVISVICAPEIPMYLGGGNLGGLWMWRGLAWILGYYIFYLFCSSIHFSCEKTQNRLIKSITIPTIISSIYAIAQYFGADQWQYVKPHSEILGTQYAGITAMIGNPSQLGIYLAICAPFIFNYSKWYYKILLILALYLCHSDIALFFCILIYSFYLIIKLNKGFIFPAICLTLMLPGLVLAINHERNIKKIDNGRMNIWIEGLKDWNSAPILYVIPDNADEKTKNEYTARNRRAYQLTGRGLGSWAFMFPMKHQTIKDAKWDTAHNEYLEALYSIGAIGLFLIIAAIWYVVCYGFGYLNVKFYGTIYTAFLISVCCAFFHPIWHIEPHRFLAVTFLSILSGRTNNEFKTSKKV